MKKNHEIVFLDFVKRNETIWFVDFLSGCLCTHNIADGKTRLVTKLPVDSEHEQYRCLFVNDDKVYLPPLFAENLLIYDIKSEQLKSVSLRDFSEAGKPNFLSVFEYGQQLFCVPMAGKGIVKINTENDEIDFYELPEECTARDEKDEKNEKKLNRPLFRQGSMHDGKIYLAACYGNYVVKFDMDSHTYEKEIISDDENDGYSSCCCTDDGMVLLSYDGSQAVLVKEQGLARLGLEKEGDFFIDLIHGQTVIHMGCAGQGNVALIDTKSGNMKMIKLNYGDKTNDLSKKYPGNGFTFGARFVENQIWVYVTSRSAVCVFDMEGRKCREFKFEDISDADEAELKKMRKVRMEDRMFRENAGIIQENGFNSLELFIDVVKG